MSCRAILLVAALALFAGARPGHAETTAAEAPALTTSVVYTADVTGAVGGRAPAGRYLDNLDLIADVDLGKAVGWHGASLHAYVLNNSGGAPNDVADTLLGVDNIEVAVPRLRVFELWLQQSLPDDRASVRVGLYNLNSEFYATEAASQFIAPSFGIGSELAATGPNGPSIFPSTSLGARFNLRLGEHGYARAAVLNAKAGVMGDPRGVDFSFRDGVLVIGQVGVDGPMRLALGAWRYSKRQPDIRELDPAGEPVERTAQGFYASAERRIAGSDEGRKVTAFVRVGASDGKTTPFDGGWQAGLRVERLSSSRPDSVASIGLQEGLLDPRFRANLRDGGVEPSGSELGLEATYSDKLTSRITLQPDLQWIRHAAGDRDRPDRWIAALRVKIDLGGGGGAP